MLMGQIFAQDLAYTVFYLQALSHYYTKRKTKILK